MRRQWNQPRGKGLATSWLSSEREVSETETTQRVYDWRSRHEAKGRRIAKAKMEKKVNEDGDVDDIFHKVGCEEGSK